MADKKTIIINAVFAVLILGALYGIPRKLMESAAAASARRKQAAEATAETAVAGAATDAAAPAVPAVQPEQLLTEADITGFAAHYAQTSKELASFTLAETQNPTYEEIETYLSEKGTLEAVNRILVQAGFGTTDTLKRYYVLCNAYGICSYDEMLAANPRKRSTIEKMGGETIARTRSEIAPADIALVQEYFSVLDAAFRAK